MAARSTRWSKTTATSISSRFDVASGRVQKLLDGRRETSAFELGPKGRAVLLDSTPGAPDEIVRARAGQARGRSRARTTRGSSHVQLGTLDEITFTAATARASTGFMLKPPDYRAGVRYPTLLQIHGGPVSQYANSFDLDLADSRGAGLCRRRRQSARQLGPRRGFREGDLRGLGRQGHGGRARSRGLCRCSRASRIPRVSASAAGATAAFSPTTSSRGTGASRPR